MALGTASASAQERLCARGGLRVRFLDEEGNTRRTMAADELDAAVARVQNIHILKSRSSSEASLLLQGAGPRPPPARRHTPAHHQRPFNNNNNNCPGESNLNAPEPQPAAEPAKEGPTGYKRDCNVYSVHQARTIASAPERRRSLPLSMPRLLGPPRAAEGRSALPAEGAEPAPGAGVGAGGGRERRALGRLARGLGRLLRRNNSVRISDPDPVYKVAYLGNVLTGWAKGDSCTEKPLATLWRNYQQSTKPDVVMKLSVANSGLKGFTKEHGLTEYWAHRITFCASPPHYPRLFCWVYRHEGKKLKHELRCHAVLCTKEAVSRRITDELQLKLKQALSEFKKDRICKQNARLSLANSVYDNPSMPRRKILLSVGAANYRPPLERSKSAPKLGAIEELCSEEDEEEAQLRGQQHPGSPGWATRGHLADHLTASRALDRRRAEARSPRKLSCPEGVMGRIRTISEDSAGASDEFINILVKESRRVEGGEGGTSHEEKACRLSLVAIAECGGEGDQQQQQPASNFLVSDSDDGSVSSGCETASTATSSDEPCSLPSHFPLDEVPRESDEESMCDSMPERPGAGPACDEVNLTPLGERNAFRRRSTYPPLRDAAGFESKLEALMDTLGDGEGLSVMLQPAAGDNDSACSDESGYSEPLDNGKESLIANTIMV